MSDNELLERGKKIREGRAGRRACVAHRQGRTHFNAEFQDFLMEYAWGIDLGAYRHRSRRPAA